MPHPERACELALGSRDGLVLFESVVQALAGRGAAQAVRDDAARSTRRCSNATA